MKYFKNRIHLNSYLCCALLYCVVWNCRWRAYDTNEGIEVAWNVVKLSRTPPSERKRIKTEVKLLKVDLSYVCHANLSSFCPLFL